MLEVTEQARTIANIVRENTSSPLVYVKGFCAEGVPAEISLNEVEIDEAIVGVDDAVSGAIQVMIDRYGGVSNDGHIKFAVALVEFPDLINDQKDFSGLVEILQERDAQDNESAPDDSDDLSPKG